MVRTQSLDLGKVGFSIFVRGKPWTKGSFNPVMSKYPSKKTGKRFIFMMEAGTDEIRKARKAWKKAVTDAVWAEWDREIGRRLEDVPVEVDLLFLVPRGKTVKRDEPHTTASGDPDKLARLILDCLTKANVYKDDAQVCDLHSKKIYADGRPCGVQIHIAEL